MTVLVTGGAGYIGSHMVHELADAGEKVIVLDNLSTGHKSALPKSVPLTVGSTGDGALVGSLIKKHGVTAILHFAASIIVPDSVRDPLSFYRNNTVNTCFLLEAAVAGGVKHFIFSSTAAVYGNPDKIPIGEDSSMQPVSPYGTSKLLSEMMLQDTARAHKLGFVILRYFNVAGADPKLRTGQSSPGATHLIKVACEVAVGKRAKISIFGTDYPTPDGTCIRDYIHVTDLAQAHSKALEYLRKGGANAVFNCGYGRGASVREVLAAVKRAAGRGIPAEESGRRAGDPVNLVADVARIRGALDWRPEYDDLDAIVKHALTWERHLQTGSVQK